jgi:putative CocE/NonD family hydrolase
MSLYFSGPGKLSFNKPSAVEGLPYEKYTSDPSNPVPYAPGVIRDRPSTYMVADQRFLSGRNDVVSYTTPVLDKDVTMAGPIDVDLAFTCSGTDADFIVKVIDLQPSSAPGNLKDAQIMIRGDVFRAKYRDSFQNPKPLKPNQVERLRFSLNDVLHTFKKGHRIMVQIQSSWFPLVDRNPHVFTNIYKAKPGDYKPATIQIMRSPDAQSMIRFGTL